MRHHLLRGALLCVAATCGLLLSSPTEASRTVVIQHGDSIDSLARKYHVSVKDIAHANSISVDAVLIDGRKLRIPDPPRSIVKAATMKRAAYVSGDRITVRLGPDESYRRLTLLDYGAPLIVTRKGGDWFQIALESGRTGWIRGDFVAFKGAAVTASHPSPSRTHAVRPRRFAAARRNEDDNQDEEDSAPRRRPVKVVAKRHHVQKIARRHRNEGDDEDRPARRRHVRMVNHIVKRHRQIADSRHRYGRHSGRPEAEAPDADADVVRTAYAYRGVPYHFGGTSRNGFDCSGFTSYVYGKRGVHLPHSAAEQFGRGQKVHSGHLKAGDLVFFHTTRRGVSHVGIYAGNGKFVHASSGGGSVRVDSLESGYYRSRLVGARRVK